MFVWLPTTARPCPQLFFQVIDNGQDNVAIGGATLRFTVGGLLNTAIGYNALDRNTSGNDNTGIGGTSLIGNTTGIGNTGIGFESLFGNTTGNYNTAVGWMSGFNISATSSSNILVGSQGNINDTNITRIGDNQSATFLVGNVSDGNGTVWSSNSVWSLSAFTNGVQNFSIKIGISNAADGMHLITLSISNGVTVMLQHLP
jgi:hypothetical protein